MYYLLSMTKCVKWVTWYDLGEKAKTIGENATQSEMTADDAWEKAEEIEVCLVYSCDVYPSQARTVLRGQHNNYCAAQR